MSESRPARSNRVRNLLVVAVLAAVAVFVVLARSAGTTGVVNTERRDAVMLVCFDVSYRYIVSIGKEIEPGYGIDVPACYVWADTVLQASPAVVDKCLIGGVVQEKQELEAACFVREGVEVPVHIIEP